MVSAAEAFCASSSPSSRGGACPVFERDRHRIDGERRGRRERIARSLPRSSRSRQRGSSDRGALRVLRERDRLAVVGHLRDPVPHRGLRTSVGPRRFRPGPRWCPLHRRLIAQTAQNGERYRRARHADRYQCRRVLHARGVTGPRRNGGPSRSFHDPSPATARREDDRSRRASPRFDEGEDEWSRRSRGLRGGCAGPLRVLLLRRRRLSSSLDELSSSSSELSWLWVDVSGRRCRRHRRRAWASCWLWIHLYETALSEGGARPADGVAIG